MDEQQTPRPRAVRSFPPGATPPTVAWTERPSFDAGADLEAPIAVPDSGVVWLGRRTLTRYERAWVGVLAVLLAGYVTFLAAAGEWAAHPVLAALTAVCGLGAVVALVVSIPARRPARGLLQGMAMRRLPRATRRVLVRRLRAGDPGPPELRSWAAYWVCLTLQGPWYSAFFLLLAAQNVAQVAAPGPLTAFRLVQLAGALGVLAVAVITIVAARTHRPAAHRVADALDHDHDHDHNAPPPPPSPGAA